MFCRSREENHGLQVLPVQASEGRFWSRAQAPGMSRYCKRFLIPGK